MPTRPIRLDHGRRQSAELPPLAEMAWHSEAGAVRGDRPPGPAFTPPPAQQAKRSPTPASRNTPPLGCPTASRRHGPSCTASSRRCPRPRCGRAQTARPAPAKPSNPMVESNEASRYLEWCSGANRGGCNERKGKIPLITPAISGRRVVCPDLSPGVLPPRDASSCPRQSGRIKAEDSVTIDLTGKTSIGDYMVVTCGRSKRHVGAVADHMVKDLKKAGIGGVPSKACRNATGC